MAAPLVERLLSSIASESDPAKRAEHIALLACYEARVGEFDAAEEKRLQLRRDFGSGHYPRISILLMCLEALQLYFRELSPKSRDRMHRANLISGLMREGQLEALTFAWLAHIDFNLGSYESMAVELTKCLQNLSADDGSAECRAALVLGDAYLFVGSEQEARKWHDKARVLASRLGDQAAFGAITYNRAAMRVAVARIESLGAEIDSSRLSMLDAEVRSAISYQGSARLKSLEHLLGSASAGVRVLRGQFELAEGAIDAVLSSGEVPAGTGEEYLLHTDRARCLAARGATERAALDAAFVVSGSLDQLSADDRAVIEDSLSHYFKSIGHVDAAATHRSQSNSALESHLSTVDRLKAVLQPFSGSVVSSLDNQQA